MASRPSGGSAGCHMVDSLVNLCPAFDLGSRQFAHPGPGAGNAPTGPATIRPPNRQPIANQLLPSPAGARGVTRRLRTSSRRRCASPPSRWCRPSARTSSRSFWSRWVRAAVSGSDPPRIGAASARCLAVQTGNLQWGAAFGTWDAVSHGHGWRFEGLPRTPSASPCAHILKCLPAPCRTPPSAWAPAPARRRSRPTPSSRASTGRCCATSLPPTSRAARPRRSAVRARRLAPGRSKPWVTHWEQAAFTTCVGIAAPGCWDCLCCVPASQPPGRSEPAGCLRPS